MSKYDLRSTEEETEIPMSTSPWQCPMTSTILEYGITFSLRSRCQLDNPGKLMHEPPLQLQWYPLHNTLCLNIITSNSGMQQQGSATFKTILTGLIVLLDEA